MQDAAQALRQALAVPEAPASDAVTELARFALAVWPVGGRYRMLLRLAPQDLGPERVDAVLAPARDRAEAITARGSGRGSSQAGVPSGPLSRALEGHLLGLLECVNAGTWTDDGTRAATAALMAVGVDRECAAAGVRAALRRQRRDGTARKGTPGASPTPMTNSSASPVSAAAST